MCNGPLRVTVDHRTLTFIWWHLERAKSPMVVYSDDQLRMAQVAIGAMQAEVEEALALMDDILHPNRGESA